MKEDRTEVHVDQPDFGIRIKNLRRDKNLSQRTLADLIDRSEDFINMIERGRSFVSLDILERGSRYFKSRWSRSSPTAETKPLSRVGDLSGLRRGLLLI